MMQGNLLFHLESFFWDDLLVDRGKQLDELSMALSSANDNNDRIFGHPSLYLTHLTWGFLYEIINFSDEQKLKLCPWLKHDHQKTLTKLFGRSTTPRQSITLSHLTKEFKDGNNGLIGIEPPEIKEYVHNTSSWNEFHRRYVSYAYDNIDKESEYFKKFYVPKLRVQANVINQLIYKKQLPALFERLDTPTHVEGEMTLHGEQIQIHFKDDKKSALSLDGTWKHQGFDLPKNIKEHLIQWGFVIPRS